MKILDSYVAGEWHTPGSAEAEARSGVDGAVVAGISSAGIDFGKVVAHARDVGGPALRRLTFHQRASMLKALVGVIAEHKDELYKLSMLTGATKRDCWIDVDGGMGVLATYASKGKRELPDAHVVVDGETEGLSRDGSFVGQHVMVPRHGVALHINAFNFPCWGMLEKLAPAILAGAPVITKPASPTAFVTEALVHRLIEADILPDGALQLIVGRTGDLLDHLGGQDSVGFTGSASTAELLRGHEAVTGRSLRFTAEADSLNSCILAGTSDAEVELFVNEVVTEMITKSGQRCTAIRKAIVPSSLYERVAEALRDRLAQVRVGDPASADTQMGPLINRDQLADVEAAVSALVAGGCEVLVRPEELLAGLPDGGAWMPPTVLTLTDHASTRGRQVGPDAIDRVEAFGPVTTLVAVDDLEQGVAIANRGEGSLVASVVAADASVARDVVLGLAAFHGRVHVIDPTMAKASTGHGSPMPHMVHGGPGRAGGGEELGGIRAVHHHLQRTAVQGAPDHLTAITGQFIKGSTRRQVAEHPMKQHFEDIAIGDSVRTEPRTITLEDIEAFAELTGDRFYAHMDEEAAAASPIFDGRVAHGYLVLSAAAGLFVWPDPGPLVANGGLDTLRFSQPTYPGDTIVVDMTCKTKSPRSSQPYGEIAWDVEVTNQRGEVCASYDLLTLVAKRDVPPA